MSQEKGAVGDLGLGSLVAKFEEYFGRKATGLLLILAYVAIGAGALAAIWTLALLPLLVLAKPILPKSLTLAGSLNLIGIAITIVGAMSAGSIALDAYRKRLARDQLEELLPEARGLNAEARSLFNDSAEDREEIRRMVGEAQEVKERCEALLALLTMHVADIVESGLEEGRITEEQGEILRELAAEIELKSERPSASV